MLVGYEDVSLLYSTAHKLSHIEPLSNTHMTHTHTHTDEDKHTHTLYSNTGHKEALNSFIK